MIKNLVCIIFISIYLNVFDIYSRHFEYSPACDVYVQLKTTDAEILKLRKRLTNNQ